MLTKGDIIEGEDGLLWKVMIPLYHSVTCPGEDLIEVLHPVAKNFRLFRLRDGEHITGQFKRLKLPGKHELVDLSQIGLKN